MSARHLGREVAILSAVAIGSCCALLILASIGSSWAHPPLDHPGELHRWLTDHDPLEVAFCVIRMATLVVAGYLMLSCSLGVAARLVRVAALVRLADAVTIPMVRRILTNVAGAGLSATVVATGGATHGVAPAGAMWRGGPTAADQVARAFPTRSVDDGDHLPDSSGIATMTVITPGPDIGPDDPPVGRPRDDDRVETSEPSESAATVPSEATMTASSSSDQTPRTWVVEPGDHFWLTASAVLSAAWQRAPSIGETHDFWIRLVDENRSRLYDPASPDLIFSGQEFVIPAPPDDPLPSEDG